MRYMVCLFFSLLTFTINVVLGQSASSNYKSLPVIAFRDQLIKGKNIILLDVRTPEEFTKGYIAGAININYFDKNFKEKIEKLPASKPIYVYCAVGGRSAKASALIAGLNRKDIYNLEGGFTAWQKLNYPIQK